MLVKQVNCFWGFEDHVCIAGSIFRRANKDQLIINQWHDHACSTVTGSASINHSKVLEIEYWQVEWYPNNLPILEYAA